MERHSGPDQGKIALLCLIAAAGIAHAGEIYKSFDANGNVVYSDHLDPSASQATTVQIEDASLPPHQMHLCGTQNCFTLVLDHGSYRRTDGSDDTWTIETFTANSVVLRRHGAATGDKVVTYAGDVANDRLINVKVNGKPTGGSATDGIDASWGTALNTLPGSNAEREANDAALMVAAPSADVSTAEMPPALPAEDQSALTEPGYVWTPGYWYWREQGYFWVRGAWVRPPQMGVLWTPGYWGFVGGIYVFHRGYWGPSVGFYGGINYGYGYFGTGYIGGRWAGGAFAYNTSVNHLSAAIRNTYAEAPPIAGPRSLMSYASASAARARAVQPTAFKAVQRTIVAQQANATPPQPVPSTRPATPHATPVVATNSVDTNQFTRTSPVAPRSAAPPKLSHRISTRMAAPIK